MGYTMEYYDNIASGYNELHREEQLAKLRIISQHIKVHENVRLLDVGCATGFSSEFFNCQIIGIEPSKEMLIQGIKEGEFSMEFLQGEGEHLPFKDGTFDSVICVTALHNFQDPKSALKEINRVVTNSGAITILKKAQKAKLLKNLVSEEFKITKVVEEEKDHILFFKINPL
jgi:ubiquinone/menaquinone biosynthesis C-methylase UbiE